MRQNVEHLKNAKDNEEKEPQVSSTLIDSGPRNEHTLLIAPYNLELYCYRIDCHKSQCQLHVASLTHIMNVYR